MAAQGVIKGSETAIEGEAGFYNAFTGNNDGVQTYTFAKEPTTIDYATVTQDLGKQWKMLSVMFRMYNTAGFNQPVIELMAEMKRDNNLKAEDIAEATLTMNYIENSMPSPAFPRFADPQVARVGSSQYFLAHSAVNGGFPVIGGKTFGPTGADVEHDQAVIDFMNTKVKLNPTAGHPMFSPSITVKMKDGRTFDGHYPYERMGDWDFNRVVQELQKAVPGFPLGQAGMDAIVEVLRSAETLPSLDRIFEVTRG